TITQMLERRVNAPPTSSMGRLFDAVASLAGVRDRVSYEGQAAIELEWLATGTPPDTGYPLEISPPPGDEAAGAPFQIDTRPLIRAIAEDARRGVEAARIARRFHATLVDIVAAACGAIRQATGLGV